MSKKGRNLFIMCDLDWDWEPYKRKIVRALLYGLSQNSLILLIVRPIGWYFSISSPDWAAFLSFSWSRETTPPSFWYGTAAAGASLFSSLRLGCFSVSSICCILQTTKIIYTRRKKLLQQLKNHHPRQYWGFPYVQLFLNIDNFADSIFSGSAIILTKGLFSAAKNSHLSLCYHIFGT